MTKAIGCALAILAVSTPDAGATHVRYDCGLHSIQQNDATGQNSEGVLTGFALGALNEAVSIRCYLRNGSTIIASSPTGSGTTVAATAGRISYTTPPLELCSYVTHSHGAILSCIPV